MTDELENKDQEELAGLMRQILRDNAKLRIELADNLKDMEDRIVALVASAVPEDNDGTPDCIGHRKYHEALIEAQRERSKLYKAIIEKSLTALIWAFFVFLGTSIWSHLQELLKK